jgi:hypothetical protein
VNAIGQVVAASALLASGGNPDEFGTIAFSTGFSLGLAAHAKLDANN